MEDVLAMAHELKTAYSTKTASDYDKLKTDILKTQLPAKLEEMLKDLSPGSHCEELVTRLNREFKSRGMQDELGLKLNKSNQYEKPVKSTLNGSDVVLKENVPLIKPAIKK